MWKFKKEQSHAPEIESEEVHEEINLRLDEQNTRLREMARRIRNLEIEAGIRKPRLREIK